MRGTHSLRSQRRNGSAGQARSGRGYFPSTDEGVATALEWLPKDKHIGLLIVPGRATAHTEWVTSDLAVQFANSMLRRFDVDWDRSASPT